MGDANPLAHYLGPGAGRDPSSQFDASWYVAVNPDVARTGIHPLVHYIMFGAADGRWLKPRQTPRPRLTSKAVIAFRGDGLGTRLLTILYGRAFADMMGFEFKVIWPGEPEPGYAAEGLPAQDRQGLFRHDWVFDADARSRGDFIADNPWDKERTLYLSNEQSRIGRMHSENFRAFVESFDAVQYESPRCLTKLMRYEMALPQKIRALWQSIAWHPQITQAMERISRVLPPSGYLAVHLRRGDIVNKLVHAEPDYLRGERMTQILHRYTPVQSFLNKIDQVRTDEKILLCGEDEEAARIFVRRYGAGRVTLSSDLLQDGSGHQAILDLMLLSRSKMLIAPFISLFSRCAAEIGDCRHLPLTMDLPLIVRELEVMTSAMDGERRAVICAMIREAAAGISPDDRLF